MTASTPPPARRVLLVEENLGSSTGHFHNFLAGLAGALADQGCEVQIAAHRNWRGQLRGAEVLPVLSESYPDRFRRTYNGATRLRAAITHNVSLAVQLCKLLGGAPPRDLVIASNINVFHALAWRFIWMVFGKWKIRRLVLNFGGPTWIQDHDAHCRVIEHRAARWVAWIYARFRRGVEAGRILATTESDHDAKLYTRLAGYSFTEVLAPRQPGLTAPALEAKSRPREPNAPFVFAWMGRNSEEKGFGCFMAATRLFLQQYPEHHCRVRIPWVEAPDGATVTLNEARALARQDPRVQLVTDTPEVSETDYGALLGSIDCLITPYVRSRYMGRTSSLALDAAATQVPLIVTAQTWMADFIERYAAGLSFPDGDAAALAEAMHQMVTMQEDFRREAVAKHRLARQAFTWDRLLTFYWTGTRPPIAPDPDVT